MRSSKRALSMMRKREGGKKQFIVCQPNMNKCKQCIRLRVSQAQHHLASRAQRHLFQGFSSDERLLAKRLLTPATLATPSITSDDAIPSWKPIYNPHAPSDMKRSYRSEEALDDARGVTHALEVLLSYPNPPPTENVYTSALVTASYNV